VSELSSQGAVTLNGFQVPALTIRRAETTVELGSGQSFMIAGLLSNSAQHTIDKAPGAGDLPILGALFRSTTFQKGQTELVIVVTRTWCARSTTARSPCRPTAITRPARSTSGSATSTTPAYRASPADAELERRSTAPEVGLNDQRTPELAADRRGQTSEEQVAAAPPGFSIQRGKVTTMSNRRNLAPCAVALSLGLAWRPATSADQHVALQHQAAGGRTQQLHARSRRRARPACRFPSSSASRTGSTASA
jgi:pilus assembly protein CpaC